MLPREPWIVHGQPKPLVSYPWCKINDYDVEFRNGLRQIRTVHEDGGGVGVLALTGNDEIIMLDLPFFAVGEEHAWTIPGGGLHKGRLPLESAQVELLEETNLVADKWEAIHLFHRFPTFSRNKHHLFLAKGVRQATAEELAVVVPDPNEIINELIYVKIDEAYEQIGKRILDAAAIIAIQWLKIESLSKRFH